MYKYEVVIENPLNAYILDKKENEIVALCTTKRPDLGFDKLKDLIRIANNQLDLENFADYLIENATECFEHQDRELLLNVLQIYFKS